MIYIYYWHSCLVFEFSILIYYLNLVYEFDILIWYSSLVFKLGIWCSFYTWNMSTNVLDNLDLIVVFIIVADTHIDLVLILSLFLFPHTSLPFVFNCFTGIKSLPYVWTKVYSPIYRSSEYLPHTNIFCASRFYSTASIFNQNISLLSTCPHEYIFFSIHSM